MKGKRITGFVLMVLGICCFIFGSIVASRVKQGESQIQSAQKGVNTVKKATKINPYAHEIGTLATAPAQKKIDAGKMKASQFKVLSFWFRLGGIILFVIGIVIMVL